MTDRSRLDVRTPALEEFERELERTAVISTEFKRTLRAWAYQAVRDAYERGQEDAQAKARIVPAEHPHDYGDYSDVQ